MILFKIVRVMRIYSAKTYRKCNCEKFEKLLFFHSQLGTMDFV